MKTIAFDRLTAEMKEIGLDVYETRYPPIKVDPEMGARLHLHFMQLHMAMAGVPLDQVAAFTKDPGLPWPKQNTGRRFNFWHFCLDLMKDGMRTESARHVGTCTIRRGMADPTERQSLIEAFAYPYIAKGGEFAAPVIDRILDHYGVDEMEITAEIAR